jgi:hypothetical protein
MSTIVIKIHTDNAAFEDGGGSEVARILRHLADEYEGARHGFYICEPIRDSNGNTCGRSYLVLEGE